MKRFLFPLLLIGCASPASDVFVDLPSRPEPAEPIVETLGLEGALKLADEHPELQEMRARSEAARARASQAGSWPDPTAIGRIEAAGTDAQEEWLAGVAQSLPLGGRLGAAQRAESLDADRLDADVESRRRSIRARVQSAFAAALFADQVLRIQRDSVADSDRALEIARSLAAAGEGLAVDVSRAQVETYRARLERDRAASLSKEAMFALAAAIGIPVQSVEGSLEIALELPALESLSAALDDHPAMKAARAGVLSHEARIDLAEAQRIPDVNVELLYRRLKETEENGFDVGLSVTLPLFSRSAAPEARADRHAAEARVSMSRLELSRELQTVHERLARALAASKALKEMQAAADEIARVMEARYSGGDAQFSELLAARRERAVNRLSYLESLREALEAKAALSGFMKP